MGVGTRTKAWRFTDINKDYSVRLPCSTPSSASALHAWSALALMTHSDVLLLRFYGLVLPDISRKDGRTDAYQRHDAAVRREVPEQGSDTRAHVFALGELRMSRLLAVYTGVE